MELNVTLWQEQTEIVRDHNTLIIKLVLIICVGVIIIAYMCYIKYVQLRACRQAMVEK
jgi:heme/copper-type cytochrome/quinol oxidase subunit 2